MPVRLGAEVGRSPVGAEAASRGEEHLSTSNVSAQSIFVWARPTAFVSRSSGRMPGVAPGFLLKRDGLSVLMVPKVPERRVFLWAGDANLGSAIGPYPGGRPGRPTEQAGRCRLPPPARGPCRGPRWHHRLGQTVTPVSGRAVTHSGVPACLAVVGWSPGGQPAVAQGPEEAARHLLLT